jgi:hypothetical protein
MEIVPGRRKAPGKLAQSKSVQLRFAPLLTIAGVFLLIHPAVQARLDQRELQPFRDAVANSDSRIEGAHKDRGYYEAFAHVDTASHDLWEMFMREQLGKPYAGADPVRTVRDYRFREPLPNVSTTAYDTQFHTNSHGMRDREYALAKPPGTFRIALLGSSNVMGWGVRYENTLDAHLERQLNDSLAVPGKTFEVLNFAFNGYSPFAQMSALERKVADFSPDLVLLVIHLNDYDWMVGDLQHALQDELPLPDDFVRNALGEARIESRTPRFLAKARLEPARSALLKWVYTHLVSRIRRQGADPVAVTLPISTDAADPGFDAAARRYSDWSETAGFRVLDASSIYAKLRNERMWKFDHYTAEAHAIIAEMLKERLADHPLVKKAVERKGATEGSQP